MRAAVLEAFGEPLVVQEVELADPRPGEVPVRLVACGVRPTDLYKPISAIVPRLLITGRRVAGSRGSAAPFLSHRLTLDDVNRGFDLMHA